MSRKETLAYNRGRDDGVQDVVAQDKERWRIATALIVAEVANIIHGGDHQCSESGIALAVDMPHANGRCYACAVVSFVGDASVAGYQEVVVNIAAAPASAGPNE